MNRIHQLADKTAAAIAPAPQAPTEQNVVYRWATVTAVHAGPPATVDLTLGGTAIPGVRRLASYTSPTVADVVLVLIIDGDPLVLGARA